jgi:hypothetical protein
MPKSNLDGQHLRGRAEECRKKANQYYDVSARDKMLKLADNYERMADTADEVGSLDLPDGTRSGD